MHDLSITDYMQTDSAVQIRVGRVRPFIAPHACEYLRVRLHIIGNARI